MSSTTNQCKHGNTCFNMDCKKVHPFRQCAVGVPYANGKIDKTGKTCPWKNCPLRHPRTCKNHDPSNGKICPRGDEKCMHRHLGLHADFVPSYVEYLIHNPDKCK